jgi:hypothetical protein
MNDCEGGVCDEGAMCDKHSDEQMREYSYLRYAPKSAVCNVEHDPDYRADMTDAGRAHLLPPE